MKEKLLGTFLAVAGLGAACSQPSPTTTSAADQSQPSEGEIHRRNMILFDHADEMAKRNEALMARAEAHATQAEADDKRWDAILAQWEEEQRRLNALLTRMEARTR